MERFGGLGVFFLWALFFCLVSVLFFLLFSSGKVSAAQQVGQGEDRSAPGTFFSHCVNVMRL